MKESQAYYYKTQIHEVSSLSAYRSMPFVWKRVLFSIKSEFDTLTLLDVKIFVVGARSKNFCLVELDVTTAANNYGIFLSQRNIQIFS